MKTCADIKQRFGLTVECCGFCHEEGLSESLQQGHEDVKVCDNVHVAVLDEGAYCHRHAEWYPAGLRCLSCFPNI